MPARSSSRHRRAPGSCPALVLAALGLCGASLDGRAQASRPERAPLDSELHSDRSEADQPEELWARGERRAAIAALERELAALDRPAPNRSRQLALWQLATHAYEAALATAERLAPALDDLRGEALYALTRYDEALRFLEPARPEHALLAVDACEALGRLDQARELLQGARQVLGPDDPRLASFEGRALARAGDHAAALERFRAALAADPLDQAALFGLGRALIATGERQQGLAALEEHRLRAPLVDALEFARQGLDLEPLHAPNLAGVGDAERALGLHQQALVSYSRALDLAAPTEVVPIALRAARLLEEDLEQLERALVVLASAFDRVRDVRLAVRAGDVARRAGDAAAARRWYGRGLELRPDDRAILERLDAVDDEGSR